jgi:replicative DNA helicase
MDRLDLDGRMPPQAVEIEEAILGGILIEKDAANLAMEILHGDDFYKPAHQHIFQTLADLHNRNNPLDILTLEQALKDKGLLDSCGGASYLSQLTRSVSSAANIEYHAQIVLEKSIKRKLILACTGIVKESYDTGSDPFDLLNQAEAQIFKLSNAGKSNSTKSLDAILKSTITYLEQLQERKTNGITGVPTALTVDKMTAGWQRGDLIIIAARPSMGKTAFVLTVARNAALHPDPDLKTNVAVFSLEMADQQLVQRLLTMEARINAQDARTGRLSDRDFSALIEAAGRLHTAKIFIDDTPGLSLAELRSKCRRLVNEQGVGLIIIDYLQLMTSNLKDGKNNREQEIAFISRGLKGLAKELNVPVIALSQLSRAVEQRGGDKRPQLSDLRESGSIEQDADVVIFLYRPEYYGITTTEEGRSTAGVAEVIIGKQRNGPTGSVNLMFIKDYARFENLSSESMEPSGYLPDDPFVDTPMLAPDDFEQYSRPKNSGGGKGRNSKEESPF